MNTNLTPGNDRKPKPATHPTGKPWRAQLNGVTAWFSAEDLDQLDAFVEENGGGVPQLDNMRLVPDAPPYVDLNGSVEAPNGTGSVDLFVLIDTQPAPLSPAVTAAGEEGVPPEHQIIDDAPVTPRSPDPVSVGSHDEFGAARAQADHDAAKEAGFALERPLFRIGTRATGMEKWKGEFDALPMTDRACTELQAEITSECRMDQMISVTDLAMQVNGDMVVGSGDAVCDQVLALDPLAMTGLCLAAQIPSGARYLRGCWPELRAQNVNEWLGKLRGSETAKASVATDDKPFTPRQYIMRTRNSKRPEMPRELWAMVSEQYTEFDTNKIAAAIAAAAPPGSRCEIDYNGHDARFDVVMFTNVDVKDVVAGEVFKAAAVVRTADDGSGGVQVDSCLWQNKCLNFIIVQVAKQPISRIRHVGDAGKLVTAFADAFAESIRRLSHFSSAWGYAVNEDAAARALAAARAAGAAEESEFERLSKMPASQVLPGIFFGIAQRQLVPLPRGTAAKQTVTDLIRMYNSDDALPGLRARETGTINRAAVVNAITRYAHEVNTDPWKRGKIESAAGSLLFGRSVTAIPAPLPWEPTPFVVEVAA